MYREATKEETAEYLAGHKTFPGSIETEHGLLVPVSIADSIITFQGKELETLLKELVLILDQPCHTVRFAIEDGTLKIKANEYMWSPPIYPTRKGS